MHFMKILTVYTLNSHLLTLKAHSLNLCKRLSIIILFYLIALDKKESIQYASKMAVKVEMLYDYHL